MKGVVLILAVFLARSATAEWHADFFVGGAHTQSSTLTIAQPSLDNNFRLRGVDWTGNSFQSPLYYGYRTGDFFQRHVGIEAEFIHLKVFSQTDRILTANGTLGGVPIGANVVMNSLVQRFNISHGLNLLLANVVLRHDLFRNGSDHLGRLLLNFRLGAGATIPHAESTVLGAADEHYQVGSPAEQIAAGAELRLWRGLHLVGEYKFTHTHETVDIVSGTASSTLNSHHAVTGVAWHF